MKDLKKSTAVTIFGALVVILQCIATFINFGAFPITLTLIPIILAGAIYGPLVGLLMGIIFGIVVAVMVVTGADPSGATMFAMHPLITVLTCIGKGALAGLLSAIVYHLLKRKNDRLAIILASVVAPFTNTVTLFTVLIIFFGSSFTVMVAALTSLNFFVELLTNVLVAPNLLGLIHRWQVEED